MKVVKKVKNLLFCAAFSAVAVSGAAAQQANPVVKTEKGEPAKAVPVPVETATPAIGAPVQTNISGADAPTGDGKTEVAPTAAPTPVSAEEAEILPYYNNYLTEYRLGPNDVITVEVFGQCPDYCKQNITVPPNARISYPLIRSGVLVAGKTVEQVAEEITKQLDEYIIDPKVTVTLDKAMSARYSVLGKVAAPGVRVLDRKVSVYEAVVESGGVTKDGDKKRVVIYSYDGQGRISPKTVNLQEIERGKGEMVFLNPGDQVFVPDRGFRLNVNTVFDIISKASVARLLFGSPF